MTKTEQKRIIDWLYEFARKQNNDADLYAKEIERLKNNIYNDEETIRREIGRYHRYKLYCEGTAEHIGEIVDFINNEAISNIELNELKDKAKKYANSKIKTLRPRYYSDEVVKALETAYLNGAGINTNDINM